MNAILLVAALLGDLPTIGPTDTLTLFPDAVEGSPAVFASWAGPSSGTFFVYAVDDGAGGYTAVASASGDTTWSGDPATDLAYFKAAWLQYPGTNYLDGTTQPIWDLVDGAGHCETFPAACPEVVDVQAEILSTLQSIRTKLNDLAAVRAATESQTTWGGLTVFSLGMACGFITWLIVIRGASCKWGLLP